MSGEGAKRLESWSEGYEPLPGIPDEFVGPDGEPRAHWLKFLGALARLDPEDMAQRFAAADRRIRDMGMSYRVYGEANERTWPLSRMPLLIPDAEWQAISAGIAQRADLLEQVLADIYGPGHLIGDGAIPSALIAGSPEYVRAMSGMTPPGGHWLRIYAADIGRGPDGRWWVLGDRAQAPSGSGYALENRLVLSRAFPTLYREMNVERLAPFFRAFREGLTGSANRPQPRICLLTPGPYSQTYFEQAYLARYLGLLLVEGEDLVMSEGKIHVRTIAGLKRADVIWRRVDTDWIDPLELNAASRLGVPGMLEALRAGNVVMANMPGTGVIESRALLSFLPGLAKRLLGRDLLLPNIATWWCGQPDARESVMANFDNLAIGSAFSDTMPGFSGHRTVVPGQLEPKRREDLRATLEGRSLDYVGQENVSLSTTPVWDNGRLRPRPFVLRVYAARTPQGWKVMPGGFARVSEQPDAHALTMAQGVQSADVWVVGDRPVEITTLLPATDDVKIVRLLGNLPSRAADNLFWLGRYLERVEATLRLVRCLSARSMDIDPSLAGGYGANGAGASQAIARLQRLLANWGATAAGVNFASPVQLAFMALQDGEQYGSALSIARSARSAASVIRERLSQDVWQLVGRLEARIQEPFYGASEADVLDRTDHALSAVAALSGLINENVNRVAGWNFLDMGRRVERGINACRFARQFGDKDATAENLDVLLDLLDSQITYRARYMVGVALAPVRDMALLDPFNPRSVNFQVQRILEHLSGLPVLQEDGILEVPKRIATRLAAELAIEQAEELDTPKIMSAEQRLMALAEAIAARYFLQSSVRSDPMANPL